MTEKKDSMKHSGTLEVATDDAVITDDGPKKEEKVTPKKGWSKQFPPLTKSQLAAIEKVLVGSTTDEATADLKKMSISGAARKATDKKEIATTDGQTTEGVRLSKLLSLYYQIHEDLLPLRKILLKWAEKCDLTKEENLSAGHAAPSALLDVMLIHFLQQTKRLPCIHEIRKDSGKDVVDENLEDIMPATPSIRWNLADVFLQFLIHFAQGDVKKCFIQITSTGRVSKDDTEFNDKSIDVMDPITDRPIAQLQKPFQRYFLNCFLATYLYFRVPRIKGENQTDSKALVSVEMYQEGPKAKKKQYNPKDAQLHPTLGPLFFKLKEYDLNKVTAELDKLNEWDYVYSLGKTQLTAGFKCDKRCTECSSTKHLMYACPQPHYAEELDRIICKLFDSEKISHSRQQQLSEVKEQLKAAIRQQLKTSEFRLDAYGSSDNGFGSNNADFDVCFRFGEEVDVKRSDEKFAAKQLETITAIESALKNAKFHRVLVIKAAVVPIVEFAIRVGSCEIEGDISYYNELALHNTRLLRKYCSWTKDDVLSKLGTFVKRWAKQCDIADAAKGSLSSYAYIILLIHFLQQLQPNPLLPVLQEMGEKKEVMMDGWDVYFCDDMPKPNWSQCTLSVGELFLQFLDYFAKFDWRNEVVQISRTNKLTKTERGWKSVMSIEDPFDRDHNLGQRIGNKMFTFIMKAFVHSREIFFTLEMRSNFMRKMHDAEDALIADSHIPQYGSALLAKCRASLGNVPRERACRECGKWSHSVVDCPKRGGGKGGTTASGRGESAKRVDLSGGGGRRSLDAAKPGRPVINSLLERPKSAPVDKVEAQRGGRGRSETRGGMGRGAPRGRGVEVKRGDQSGREGPAAGGRWSGVPRGEHGGRGRGRGAFVDRSVDIPPAAAGDRPAAGGRQYGAPRERSETNGGGRGRGGGYRGRTVYWSSRGKYEHEQERPAVESGPNKTAPKAGSLANSTH